MKRSIKRLLATGASVLALTAAAVTTAPTASAAPSDCGGIDRYEIPGWTIVYCYGGTGYYRSLARCSDGWGAGYDVIYVGPWRAAGTGDDSEADCSSSYPYLISTGMETL
ncbi:hypothetical protein [Streptomyces sp. NPDC093111]|uniref:hypothetical protein n=1 Tax=Streptomyces sp. NPDC093111 TaxID=3154978 RepID=UPI00342A4A7A